VPGQTVVDAGAKAFARDVNRSALRLRPAADAARRVCAVNDYHGFVDPTGPDRGRIGQVLAIAPNHVCPVVDHHAETIVVRDGHVVDIWPVDARGRSR
jgi:D-serine deaminase-like pyridoxal phosphate-dependent protein